MLLWNDLERLDRSNSEYRRHTKARASRSPASPRIRHKRASGACNFRASALIEAGTRRASMLVARWRRRALTAESRGALIAQTRAPGPRPAACLRRTRNRRQIRPATLFPNERKGELTTSHQPGRRGSWIGTPACATQSAFAVARRFGSAVRRERAVAPGHAYPRARSWPQEGSRPDCRAARLRRLLTGRCWPRPARRRRGSGLGGLLGAGRRV